MKYLPLVFLLAFALACAPATDAPNTTSTDEYTFTQLTDTSVTFEENSALGALEMSVDREGATDRQANRYSEESQLTTQFLGQNTEQSLTYYRDGTTARVQRAQEAFRTTQSNPDVLALAEQHVDDTDLTLDELLEVLYIPEAQQLLGLSNRDLLNLQESDVTITQENGMITGMHVTALIHYEDEVDTLILDIDQETTFTYESVDITPPPGLA